MKNQSTELRMRESRDDIRWVIILKKIFVWYAKITKIINER